MTTIIKSRHLRWNCEKSPDSTEEKLRYHLVVVDDKGREEAIKQFIEQLQQTGCVKLVRSVEDKVKGSKYRFLFESYESRSTPKILDWNNLKKPVVRDRELYERKTGSDGIVNYVENLFN
jgi:hypothetical protein